ncbi:hypothetical protein CISIN_1g048120mg [Citrus sinensis]|uniref:Uncharacterized protein n=1 Tax=Citrus sinensis TaxID=2711 RepID=A0A067DSQ0_CITSI|nr:hypothetical protein CISIN_1g048120mg [Citrus sinensis]
MPVCHNANVVHLDIGFSIKGWRISDSLLNPGRARLILPG